VIRGLPSTFTVATDVSARHWDDVRLPDADALLPAIGVPT
jgi:hypothetical protein